MPFSFHCIRNKLPDEAAVLQGPLLPAAVSVAIHVSMGGSPQLHFVVAAQGHTHSVICTPTPMSAMPQ